MQDLVMYPANNVTLTHISGDGGNDVSMIQAANVGLGIVGKVSFYLDDL